MAKKKTATQKLKTKVKRQIKSLEKRGYIVPEKVKENVENANFSRLKSYEKEGYKRLYKESEFLDITTGELQSGTKGKQTERTKAYREAKQSSPEDAFYNQTGYQRGGTLMDSSEPIISNIIDDLVSKLQQDVPDYYFTQTGKRKYIRPEKKEKIEKKRDELLRLIEAEITDDKRKNALAKRITENSINISHYLDMLFSYEDEYIAMGYSMLHSIIMGGTQSAEELAEDDAYSDFISGYNEPY